MSTDGKKFVDLQVCSSNIGSRLKYSIERSEETPATGEAQGKDRADIVMTRDL